MVGREHLVVVVADRGYLARGNDVVAVDEAKIELGCEPALTCDRVRADVSAREDGGRADRSRRPTVSATTSPRRTSSAPPSRRRDASRSASDSWRKARRPGLTEARAADAVVDDEERQHRLGGLDRCRERRVVVNAKVAGEENDRDLHRGQPQSLDLGGDAVHPVEPRHDGEHALARAVRDVGLELRPVVDQVAAAARGAERVLGGRVRRGQPDRCLGGVAPVAERSAAMRPAT